MINNGLTQYLLDFGYSDKDIQYIRSSYALKYFKQETLFSNIRSINDYFKNLGFCNDDIKKMIKSLPSIYGLSIENIKLKIKNLIDLGYSKDEVIKMTKIQPTLYNLNIENIKLKINDIMSLGYSKDEVIKMTKSLPALFSLGIENIKKKIEFYKLIQIDRILINNSKYLMQSIELSYARYMFYLSKNIIINEENYLKLFINQKQFKKMYNIDNTSLLSMYDYNKLSQQESKLIIP